MKMQGGLYMQLEVCNVKQKCEVERKFFSNIILQARELFFFSAKILR